jgi:hypothetical protein
MTNELLPWALVAAFLAKEVVTYLVKNFFKRGEDHANILQENTKEVIKLRAELNFIHQIIQDVPKMKQDLNEAHTKIREIRVQLKENE